MANVPIRDIPGPIGEPNGDTLVAMDNGTMLRTTVKKVVEAGRPIASQAEAEAGADNAKAMTPLLVKQAITVLGSTMFTPIGASAGIFAARDDTLAAAGDAMSAADAAQDSEDAAAGFAGQAEGFKNTAATSAGQAMASANASASSAVLSQAWAESPSAPGAPGTKSAKTWAGEAATARDGVVAAAPHLNFLSVAALRLFAGATVAVVATVVGWHALTLKGGGQFYHDGADTTTADDGGYCIVDAAGRRWKRLNDGPIRPEQFGAKVDNSADDYTAAQAAINYAQTAKRELVFPAGNLRYGTTLVIAQPLKAFGQGGQNSKLIYTGAGGGLSVVPSTSVSANNTFYYLADFAVEPSVAGGGTYGVQVIAQSSEYVSNSALERLYIGDFGTRGLHLHNNTGGVTGAIFSFRVRDCWITNGIVGYNIGDSLTFEFNTIHSARNVPGFDLSLIEGARELNIRGNNVTCLGGGGIFTDCVALNLENNWFELPYYYGNYAGAAAGLVALVDCNNARVSRNTIQPLAFIAVTTSYGLAIVGTDTDPVVDENELGSGETSHILIAATVSNAYVGSGNKDIGGAALVVNDNGVGTRGILKTPALNGTWVDYGASHAGITYRKNREGEVRLSGHVKSGAAGSVICVLPAGFRPASTAVGTHMDITNGAVGYVTVESNGNVTHQPGGSIGSVPINMTFPASL